VRARFRIRTQAGILVAVGGRWTAIACAALGALVLACGAPQTYVCSSDAQCGAQGVCETDGGCSFADPECDSGRRFAEFTPAGNVCVPTGGATPTSSTTSATSSEPASATLEPDGTSSGTTTLEPGSTSSGPGVITTSSSSTGGPGTSSSEGSSTGENAMYDFFDDFERPDSDDVGNGWVEKTPDSFALIDGGIRRVGSTLGYANNLVYRPNDQWLDAQATVELTWLNLEDDFASPQCGLRVQPEDIDTPGSVTGYLLFINGSSGLLTISRQIAGAFTQEHIQAMTGAVEVGPLYRLRLRVEGSDPVILDGYLEQFVADEWVLHSETHGIDDTAEQISQPGTLVVGGHVQTEYWTYESVGLESLDG